MRVKGPLKFLLPWHFEKPSPGTKWLEGLGNHGVIRTCGRKNNFDPANNNLLVDKEL
jgi:hypothetical protein